MSVVGLARWAARAFADYDKSSVDRIIQATVVVAQSRAAGFAVASAQETGYGVVADRITAAEQTLKGHGDFVSPRIVDGSVEIPRPLGPILVRVPASTPVSTVYESVFAALLTRNALVVVPDPAVREVTSAAVRVLADAAVSAGAPAGVIQLGDETAAVDVALAVPAVEPAGVPVFVDETADLPGAAGRIVYVVAFDNASSGTGGSAVIATQAAADGLLAEFSRVGGHLLTDGEAARLPPAGITGRSATEIAASAGIRVPDGTRVLLAPAELAVPGDPLTGPHAYPVLGFVRVNGAAQGVRAARAVAGAGGPAASVYSRDPATIWCFAAGVPVRYVSINSSDYPSYLSASAQSLVTWTRIGSPAGELGPAPAIWQERRGPVPSYPHPSNLGAAQP